MSADLTKQQLSFQVAIGKYAIRSEDVASLYFVEDVFSLCIAGRLRFNDKLGIIERQKSLTGQQSIIISYGALISENNSAFKWDPANSYTIAFYIQSIVAAETNRANNTKMYDIIFVDPAYYAFNYVNYSYSWLEKSGQVIVEDFVKNLCKLEKTYELYFEPSDDLTKLQSYYSPYWNFRKNVQYLIPRTRSKKYQVSGYLAYSQIIGSMSYKFSYVSLESLMNHELDGVKQSEIANKNKFDFYPMGYPLLRNLNCPKVMDFRIMQYDNFSMSPILGATYFGYDPAKGKKPFKKTFLYDDYIAKTTILGDYSLFPSYKPDAKYDDPASEDTDPLRPIRWTDEIDENMIENLFYDDWVKRYDQQQMLEVVVLGDCTRTIGDLAQIYMPKHFDEEGAANNGLPGQTVLDEGALYSANVEQHIRWAGPALIKSITHYFISDQPGYLQKIVLIKNGLNDMPSCPFLKASSDKEA